MSEKSGGTGSGSFGGLVFLVGLVAVVAAAILPVASEGFEAEWQWMLLLVVGSALLAGGLAISSLAMLVRSVPDSRDELTKISRKVDRLTTRLEDDALGMPAGRESQVDRAFARETSNT